MDPSAYAQLQASDEQLLDIVYGVRRIYLYALENALGTRETTGSCFYGCVLLAQTLERFTGSQVIIRGGGDEQAGYFDGGRWRGHYWVELKTQHRGVPISRPQA